ncbi:MAG: cobalt-precorrin-5B (C(1))-methyltransferase CbiD [Synergistaceae bacterium]|jgi:cobalt-precorrin-5B (C1)-methyltransferase|nr:cobalt-precorrin-5B (C(1))-methyltransferase CbiD [Synergistaceae bacterium]
MDQADYGGENGFTIEAAAAAAAVASVRFLTDRSCSSVWLSLPAGREAAVPVTGCVRTEKGAEAWVTKDSGDAMDVTHGTVVVSSVEILDVPGVTVLGGKGVGVVTKPGLLISPGKAAINHSALALIRKSIEAELPTGNGAIVSISIPGGEELAKRTYNPRLGIVGGLSILSNGSAAPAASAESVAGSIKSELSALSAAGARIVCLVPGNYGRRVAMLLGVPEKMIVNISNFAGEALAISGNFGFEKLILIGQIGKFAKLSAGSLDTHSSKSDGRLEALAAYSALHGADRQEVRAILDSSMTDEVATRIAKTEWGRAALLELVKRIVKTARSGAIGVSECACLTFSLPDRELARTQNLDKLIKEIKKNASELK